MDSQWLDLIKTLGPISLTSGGALGFYMLYRKFEADRAESLREDNKTLRGERDTFRDRLERAEATLDQLRAEIRQERDEFRDRLDKAEAASDRLRARLREGQ